MCVFFVAAAMIEYAVLLHLNRISDTIASQFISPSNMQGILASRGILDLIVDNEKGAEGLLNIDNNSTCQKEKWIAKQERIFLRKTKRIDYITLFVSCITFCLFNCVYWTYYFLV